MNVENGLPIYLSLSDLLLLKRKSFAFGHCLSTTTSPRVCDFDAAGQLGGIVRDGDGIDKDYNLVPFSGSIRF